MNNIKSIIIKHNAHIIRNSQSQNTETDNCNCDNKNTCPLPKQCMTNNIIYKATVTTNNTNDTKHYIGIKATTFKGKWQYIFLFSHLKEQLKLFNNFSYRFFISRLVFEIFSLEVMRCQPSWIIF